MPLDATSIALYVLGAAIILLAAVIARLQWRLSTFMRGSDGRTLETAIRSLEKRVQATETKQQKHTEQNETMGTKLTQSVRGIATVRFTPFRGTGEGGNQSFATAFLSEAGDGVVISSLYTRERFSMFAKPLTAFASSYELTEEEQEAVNKAKRRITAAA